MFVNRKKFWFWLEFEKLIYFLIFFQLMSRKFYSKIATESMPTAYHPPLLFRGTFSHLNIETATNVINPVTEVSWFSIFGIKKKFLTHDILENFVEEKIN